ncbi:MAG: hypothetical protein ABS68_06820 [Niastella sp. SCN 39-18]|nr:polymer-forming cytoskeletal protein [Sphingobacteriales bacterium]ODT53145.1 MAG: hypothetical protein ABS68_06820 [Niastella sp. SCN 39-18]OJW08720.1 MAG: hypothetical protein BGO53_13660 [Sphingobacteriales bacterium 39-19]
MFTSKVKSFAEKQQCTVASLIHNSVAITGNLESEGDLRMDGTLKGSIRSKAKVIIGPSAVVEGNVWCKQAEISGHIKGSLIITDLLQLKGNAVVEGDISTGKLLMETTASFNGQCKMGANVVELNKELQLVVNE